MEQNSKFQDQYNPLPQDADGAPAQGLYDASGHGIVAERAYNIALDTGATGEKIEIGDAGVDASAAQGPVNIASINGSGSASPALSATCTASQDNTITFAKVVRTIMLHNQSAVNVPYEHDLTAGTTSAYLAPGQLVYVDVHTGVLHVFPSNSLPINAANGLIVRGWQ